MRFLRWVISVAIRVRPNLLAKPRLRRTPLRVPLSRKPLGEARY